MKERYNFQPCKMTKSLKLSRTYSKMLKFCSIHVLYRTAPACFKSMLSYTGCFTNPSRLSRFAMKPLNMSPLPLLNPSVEIFTICDLFVDKKRKVNFKFEKLLTHLYLDLPYQRRQTRPFCST